MTGLAYSRVSHREPRPKDLGVGMAIASVDETRFVCVWRKERTLLEPVFGAERTDRILAFDGIDGPVDQPWDLVLPGQADPRTLMRIDDSGASLFDLEAIETAADNDLRLALREAG